MRTTYEDDYNIHHSHYEAVFMLIITMLLTVRRLRRQSLCGTEVDIIILVKACRQHSAMTTKMTVHSCRGSKVTLALAPHVYASSVGYTVTRGGIKAELHPIRHTAPLTVDTIVRPHQSFTPHHVHKLVRLYVKYSNVIVISVLTLSCVCRILT